MQEERLYCDTACPHRLGVPCWVEKSCPIKAYTDWLITQSKHITLLKEV